MHAGCALEDAAGVAFAEALKVNATLQKLTLYGACVVPAALRVEGGKALARVCAADMCVCVCVCVRVGCSQCDWCGGCAGM